MGRLPVRYSWHYHPFDVFDDFAPLFTVARRRFGYQIAHIARLNAGKDMTISNIFKIVCDVVDHFLPCRRRLDLWLYSLIEFYVVLFLPLRRYSFTSMAWFKRRTFDLKMKFWDFSLQNMREFLTNLWVPIEWKVNSYWHELDENWFYAVQVGNSMHFSGFIRWVIFPSLCDKMCVVLTNS